MLQCGLFRSNFAFAITFVLRHLSASAEFLFFFRYLPGSAHWASPWHLSPLAKDGAGEGNRTLVISLEGCCSTIELHPRGPSVLLLKPSFDPASPARLRPSGFAAALLRPFRKSGGGSRTRTYEGVASGFTVRPLCRSGHSPSGFTKPFQQVTYPHAIRCKSSPFPSEKDAENASGGWLRNGGVSAKRKKVSIED